MQTQPMRKRVTVDHFDDGVSRAAETLFNPIDWGSASACLERRFYFATKRALDIFIAVVALIFLAPLFLLVGLLIKLDSSGPVFFKQERLGYDRCRKQLRPFMIWKFRTMRADADQTLHQHFVKQWIGAHQGHVHASGVVPNKAEALKNDPRVTRLGRFLRRTSIDELPQLWNVALGDMSLVGPRPVPVYEAAEYEERHRIRLLATPGITCLWQLSHRGQTSLDQWAELDAEYIARQSLWLDLRILILTPLAVIKGRGAV